MATKRSTFGKLQRERDKKARAVAKQERRAEAQTEERPAAVALDEAEEQRLMTALADLHRDLEAGIVSLTDFETRRDDIRSQLEIR
jgi:CRP-like cAMP-binding protein